MARPSTFWLACKLIVLYVNLNALQRALLWYVTWVFHTVTYFLRMYMSLFVLKTTNRELYTLLRNRQEYLLSELTELYVAGEIPTLSGGKSFWFFGTAIQCFNAWRA